ncbi:MAG: hypothetical protein Q8N55_01545, partial [bacterium]|nr:hypothetical protein [bacterium]
GEILEKIESKLPERIKFRIQGGQPGELLGGDEDEHGCIGSAGYTWCEIKEKCLRTWEEPCQEQEQEQNQGQNGNENNASSSQKGQGQNQ